MEQNTILQEIHSIMEQDQKPISFMEAAIFLDISESYLYKLTHKNQIAFYKPNGKKIYFLKSDLKKWLLRNRASTVEELKQKAQDHVTLESEVA